MKALVSLVIMLVASSAGFGGSTSGDVAADPSIILQKLVSDADSATIRFSFKRGEREVSVSDTQWLDRLASILSVAEYRKAEMCFCVSTPIISIQENGKEVLSLSVHHGDKLRAFGQGIPGGDFYVGSQTGGAVGDLAMDLCPEEWKREPVPVSPTLPQIDPPRVPDPAQ
jgi:hypothetical protein